MTSMSLVRIPFHGEELLAVQDEHGVWVVIKRVCESLGLQAHGQAEKLAEKAWAVTQMKCVTAPDGKNYEMLCIHLDCVPMWLATIEPSRVAEEVRPKLVVFQKECARVLRDYFFKGQATNPRSGAEPHFPDSPIARFDRVERAADRLLREGKVTGTQAADMVTRALKEHLGFDATDTTPLVYAPRSLPTSQERPVATVVEPVDTTLFPFLAGEAGLSCKEDIEAYRKALLEQGGKRYRTELSREGYGKVFAAVMRELGAHPEAAKGYEPTPVQVEAAKAYTCRVPMVTSTSAGGVVMTHTRIRVQFNHAAIALVRAELRRRTVDLVASPGRGLGLSYGAVTRTEVDQGTPGQDPLSRSRGGLLVWG